MKTAGIIAEYNPFHRGHEYQIQYTKEKLGADYVIVTMSGDYVQRGTPALISKHLRAEMALRCGADLVLEMPVSVSTASAEAFAMGGVSLLDSLGVVDMLCFGSESGEISTLQKLAEILVKEPDEYKHLLKSFLSQGLSFPTARSQALTEYLKAVCRLTKANTVEDSATFSSNAARILNTPNNILGIEYCKALLRLNSKIQPVTIRREGMGYHDTFADAGSLTETPSVSGTNTTGSSLSGTPDSFSPSFASASAIRNLLCQKTSDPESPCPSGNAGLPTTPADILASQIPENAFFIFKNILDSGEFLTEDALDPILVYCLLQKNIAELASCQDVSGNLAQRIMNQKNLLHGFSQSAALLKTKELTQTRIQRALLHIILGIHHTPERIPYARVLGFRKESSPLLKEIKKNSRIPVITKLADASRQLDLSSQALLEETTFASNLYESLLSQKSGKTYIHEYEKKIIIS